MLVILLKDLMQMIDYKIIKDEIKMDVKLYVGFLCIQDM
jgi:hypothetical protein